MKVLFQINLMDGEVQQCNQQCGHALCQKCSRHEDALECQVLKALNMNHMQPLIKAKNQGQLPNHVYEPVLPLRLLLQKW